MQNKLSKLAAESADKGRWALAAAATRASTSDTVDDHINVLGAMHEVGLLKNSFAPFAKVWRADTAAFAAACVARLDKGDADYWALAALLGLNVADVAPVLVGAGFELLAVTRVPAFKDSELHVATLARRQAASPEVLTSPIDLGWNAKTGELLDVSRWRAVVLEECTGVAPQLSGSGFGSYYMRAKLPFGCWRLLHDKFSLDADAAVAADATLWKKREDGL
ncbi:hypothetical protein ACSFBX_28955 [Variovorax sp. RB2P76]|uniref:hypothetical protein n=1 Tax=Variovorax sp. RB2P76 TaxID=3443736 RepID=UPI003F46A647